MVAKVGFSDEILALDMSLLRLNWLWLVGLLFELVQANTIIIKESRILQGRIRAMPLIQKVRVLTGH